MYHIFTYYPAGTEISYYLRRRVHRYHVALQAKDAVKAVFIITSPMGQP